MSTVKYEFDPKGVPFRRLGPSGLRVPVFSLGGCEYITFLEVNVCLIDQRPRADFGRDRHRRPSQGE